MEFFPKFFHSFNASEPGYVFMWILLLAGIFSAAIAIERSIFLMRRSGSRTEPFMRDILDKVAKGDIEAAQKRCSEAGRMAMAQIVKVVLISAGSGENHIRNSTDESVLKVVPELEKRTGYLATIGNVATLIGLMGTIYGLILSFASVGKPGIDPMEKSTLLASGIATAMNTTFMGLMVAIPSIILYSIFKSKTDQLIDEIDEYSLKFANTLVEKTHKATKYNISTSELKDSVSLHVTGSNIKLFADNRLVKNIKR